MVKKQVTYEIYSENSGELELSLGEMLDLFDRTNWQKGSFAYFPIDKTYIFQIIYHKNSFIVEFTDTENAVSYQKQVDNVECRKMIKSFFERQYMTHEMMDGFDKQESKFLYDSVKGNLFKEILFWVIFIGFFVGLAVLGAYIIYW